MPGLKHCIARGALTTITERSPFKTLAVPPIHFSINDPIYLLQIIPICISILARSIKGKKMRKKLLACACALALPALADTPTAIAINYADIAEAKYSDSLNTAKRLEAAVKTFVANPNAATQLAARNAWLAARVPYQQTEAFRFGNTYVDEWEGKVNAWPLDEGLIDYVEAGYDNEENPLAGLNIVAKSSLQIGGETVDAGQITPALVQSLHEAGGIETNVAAGYHAIEFLLWGQDLNGTEHGAGNRPYTDFASGSDCTNGHCDRRADYLVAASELLVSDLEDITAAWGQNGEARTSIVNDENPLARIVFGLGSLSYGELAGERMKLGLLLNDPEEEHDCFADNTHNSHFYDVVGINNLYYGRYSGANGLVEGASLANLVRDTDANLADRMESALAVSMQAFTALKATAEAGMSYDQMLGANNPVGNQIVERAVNSLVAQTAVLEDVASTLNLGALEFEGSDSLDNPTAVF